ncbi:MAG: DNA-deoxyinosine glycosylase [Gammaproteobacteria bacterium]|nr:DNA-deoxyinosine glycosylase [Gammaproteobacteria bacterium]
MDVLTGFDCIADRHSKILILGSMPGVASLQQQQYYAHPRNAFWKIMEALFDIPAGAGYESRLEGLKQNQVALWDVAHQCVRPGSLDSNIQPDSVQVNDFSALFKVCPAINNVYFNGGKSAQLYKKWVLNNTDELIGRPEYIQLPSTSPANARLSLDQKITAWQQINR